MIDLTQDEIFDQKRKPDIENLCLKKLRHRIPWMQSSELVSQKNHDTQMKTRTRKKESVKTLIPNSSSSDVFQYYLKGNSYLNNLNTDSINVTYITDNRGINFETTYTNSTTVISYSTDTHTRFTMPINGIYNGYRDDLVDVWGCVDGELRELDYEKLKSPYKKSSIFAPQDIITSGSKSSDLIKPANSKLPKNIKTDRYESWVLKDALLYRYLKSLEELAGFRRDRFRDFLSENWHRLTIPFFRKKWFRSEENTEVTSFSGNIFSGNIEISSNFYLN